MPKERQISQPPPPAMRPAIPKQAAPLPKPVNKPMRPEPPIQSTQNMQGGGRFANAEVEALKNQLEEARVKRMAEAYSIPNEPTPIIERESSDGEQSEVPTNIVIDSKGSASPKEAGVIKPGTVSPSINS